MRLFRRICTAPEYGTCILWITVLVSILVVQSEHTSGANQSPNSVSAFHSPLFWVVLIGGGLLVTMQACGNYWQQWYDPKWALYFLDQFNSEDMLKDRAAASEYFKKNKEWDDYVDHVLNTIEDIAFSVDAGVISRDVAHHYFDYWVRSYLQLTQDYRDNLRREERYSAIWNHCDDLLKELNKVEAKITGRKPEQLRLTDKGKEEFLDEEIRLVRPFE